MRSMNSYSKAAMERAMKIQEVILRAMAKKIMMRNTKGSAPALPPLRTDYWN